MISHQNLKPHLTLLKPHFIKPVPCWWTLGSVSSFATASEATMNVLALHVPLCTGYPCDTFRAMQLLEWKISAFKMLIHITTQQSGTSLLFSKVRNACCLSQLGDKPVCNAILELSFPELNPLFLCDPVTSVRVKCPLSHASYSTGQKKKKNFDTKAAMWPGPHRWHSVIKLCSAV